MRFFRMSLLVMGITTGVTLVLSVSAQEKSVKPGINDTFKNPNPKDFVEKFEVESREVFAKRKEIVEACQVQPGQTVADIGAGTGLFTRLFAEKVGPEGKIVAVDIAQKFLDHIETTSKALGQKNVETRLCTADSTQLPPESVDMAFICDVYHHFEYPGKSMASLFKAVKPGGKVFLIDFRRVEGESKEWTLKHVRAGQEVFEAEIEKVGFKKLGEEAKLLKENYFVRFEKPVSKTAQVDQPHGNENEIAQSDGLGKGRGMGRGRGMGMGRGMGRDVNMQSDMNGFHYLLQNHEKVRRTVKKVEKGVETLTESDDAEVVKMIQEHVLAMKKRLEEGRGLRFWDELFAEIFIKADKIKMIVEKTPKGVRVTETSDDSTVVLLIQSHADVVSKFADHGFEEAHKNHQVPAAKAVAKSVKLEYPIIAKFGGVLPRPKAVDQPKSGSKVVFDTTADSKAGEVNKGLDRAARLLNLYGVAGLNAKDVRITVVLHGEATKAALGQKAYAERFQVETNPNLILIRELQKVGVEVVVCGQALQYKGFSDNEVAEKLAIVASALTAVINRQADGYSYVPVP